MPPIPLRRAALALLCLVGCPAQGQVSEDEFPPALADALCETYAACACTPSMSTSSCQADMEADVLATRVPPAGSGLRYAPHCGTRLVEFVAGFGCETPDERLAAADDDACDPCKLYSGDRGLGESCTIFGSADDCVQGAACVEGTCVDVCAPVPLGEPCIGRRCEGELVCRVDLDLEGEIERSACVRDAAVGEPCVDDAVCSFPMTCDYEADVCRALPAVGEPCEYQCAAGWCESTGTTGTCRAPQANGAACTFEQECEGDCDLELGVCISAEALACGWVE